MVLGWVPAQEGLSDLTLPVTPTPEPSPPHQSPTLRLSFEELQICVIEKKCMLITVPLENPGQQREMKSPIIPPPMTASVDI